MPPYNPMTPGPTHSGNYIQPWGLYVPPPQSAIAPGFHGNPMNVGASATQWKEQSDYRKPVGRGEAPITKLNPMGC